MAAGKSARRFETLPTGGPTASHMRLVTGLVLFTFAGTHLLNHALGLVSLEVMESVRAVRTAVTRSLPGTTVLIACALIHLSLGITSFLRRRMWQLRIVDWIQLAFGLLIPLLLMRHVLGTRAAHELFGINDDYHYALWVMWPGEAWRQALLILLVWTHGCIGLNNWLRLKPWYRRHAGWFYVAAALVPVLGFSGFATGGRLIRHESAFASPFTADQFAVIKQAMDVALYGYLALLVLILAVRLAAGGLRRYRARIRVAYAGGPTVSAVRGVTLLEVSRAHNIPHASVCGGRARCSTCRVRVLEGLEEHDGPDALEAQVLQRVGATRNVRLACQLRLAGDIRVATLLPTPDMAPEDLRRADKYLWGVEQPVTLMFADLRGFTRMSESRLAYDVVFLLNQYLGRMAEAIEDSGGYVDKFMGDGIMAIFGMEQSARDGARTALSAARAMGGVLQALNQSLRDEVPDGLDIGIGIHSGPAILGRVGVAGQRSGAQRITALGDTVNTASRLEAACKRLGVQLVVSQATIGLAGDLGLADDDRQVIEVPGRIEPIAVYALARAVRLPAVRT